MKNVVYMRSLASSVALVAILGLAPQAYAQAAPSDEAEVVEEITVTATRQSQAISKVPISISAFDNETLQRDGVRKVDDIVRFTPGLALNRGITGSNVISIRGITSGAGAGVTGIYIDETPIQVRNEGYGAGSAFPEVFDLERIEVLRGPQGTLFGAGSQGGTVRFIQAAPNMDAWSVYARSELASTDKGSETYEAGVAVGGPLIADRLAFRASVYFRKNGGFIDAVEGTYTPVAGAVAQYPNGNLINFRQTRTVREDTNSDDALNARLAVEFRPTEWLSLTPSISYQRTRQNDGANVFWPGASDVNNKIFNRVVFSKGSPATNAAFTDISAPDTENATDEFVLYALNAQAELGGADLISSTSFFDRSNRKWLDFTLIDTFQFGGFRSPPIGYKSASLYEVGQKNFVQEVRLQSSNPSARLRWVVGGFFSSNKQTAQQNIFNNFVDRLPVVFGAAAGGSPFGPGTSAIVNALGVPQLPGGGSYSEDRKIDEEQYAGFAQVDFRATPELTLTLGARVAHNVLKYNGIFRGPLNNDNPPLGFPCPTAGGCTPGTGVFTPLYQDTIGLKNSETAFTPKFGISWQATNNDLFYASISKGFRPAGVSAKVPANFCGPDLALTGYVDGNGNSAQPVSYKSDSVWSYEVGAKNKLFGGRMTVDASAYLIKWSNIQNSVFLPNCLYGFVDNLGDATSRGFDLALNVEPVEGLRLGTNVSYNKADYNGAVVTPGNVSLFPANSAIAANRPWTLTFVSEYYFKDYYLRADTSYFSEARAQAATDRASPLYNPLLRPDQAYTAVNLRAGVLIGKADVSIFVNNVTNAAPVLGSAAQIGGLVYTASTIRPRTVGITASWRQ
ncbi:TonB-dependent receptor [Novosphingobium piscinae]|uniref:TonB-dependent receptor n=1 Tax=Novosphingobium piscinae TaxID=1507448 RepID=A0A7X1FWU3_9SPHN|nr:TonB-dependent receptor [Novosphingobium piscinae]MBC2668434.1 TonB-dependent receptor [Novosphingobium piscinae]